MPNKFLLFIFALLLLLLPVFTLLGQPDTSNTKYAEPAIVDYDKLISRYRYYKPDSAIYFANKGMALARQKKDVIGEAMMLNQLGMIDDNRGMFDDSRQKYLRALNLYKQAGSKKGMAIETVRLGVVELRKGNYDKAIGYFLNALKLSEQDHNKAGIMEANLTLAEGYMGQKEYGTALSYLNKAQRLDSTLPFSNLSLNILNNFGVIYRETGYFKRSISYFEKGISLSNQPKYQGLNITLTNNLASVYAKMGQKKQSIGLQRSALKKAIEIQNYLREFQTLTGLAATYGKDNADSALYFYNKALVLVQEKGAQKQAIEILNQISELQRFKGDYKAAFEAKDKQNIIADRYFYREMSKQIANLQTDYELQKSKASVQELKYANSQQVLQRKIMLTIIAGGIIILGILVFFYTRTHHLNKLLNKTNADLTESNTVKDKLFSVLAHDLRSPFASVINLLYLINDDDLTPEEKKEVIEELTVTSNASLETLNMLLKWGQMQIKGVRLNQVNLQPQNLIERNIALLSSAAGKKSISIKNKIEEDVIVLTDPDHFEFIFRNLLSNAIKFTPDGGEVTVSTVTDTEDGVVRFIVKDTGIGVDKNRLEQIFSISNVSTNGTNDEKGTSLGLVMCREFAEANNGKIWVESTVGEGSEFIFQLDAVV